MTNPNPFLRSPLDTLADDLNQQASTTMAAIPAAPVVQDAPDSPVVPAPSRRPPKSYAKPATAPAELRDLFNATAEAYGVPVNILMALAEQESGYRHDAVGQRTKAGRALGMMQFLPSTADSLGINPLDPNQAVPAAAMQLRERLDKGASMEDAVMEHFAGPDRKQWGDKTAQYGLDVMDRAGRIGKELMAMPAPAQEAAPSPADTNHMGVAQNRADYEASLRAANPNASPELIAQGLAQFDADKIARGQSKIGSVKQGFDALQTPEARFDARLNAKLAKRHDKGGVVPPLPGMAQAPLSDEAKGLYGARYDAQGNALTDLAGNLKVGMNTAAQDVRELVGHVPLAGDAIVKGGDSIDQFFHPEAKDSGALLAADNAAMTRGLTPETQAAQQKKWWDSDKGTFGPAWSDPRAYASGVVQSLPEQALTMFPAARLAKMAYTAKIAGGASVAVASSAAARTAAIAGAMGEGSLGGAQSAREVRDTVTALPDATLNNSDAFKSMVAQGMNPAEAKSALANDLATRAFVASGIVTGMFGGMGDRTIAKLFTEQVGQGVVKRALSGFVKGGAAEGLMEELPQSIGQQVVQNAAVQVANPDQKLGQDVINQALGGMATGALQGGAMGGGAAIMNPNGAHAPTPAQTAPIPATAVPTPVADRPMAAAVEQAAAPAHRVVVTTPDGSAAAGTLAGYKEGPDGQFVARIQSDDGQIVTITDQDGELTVVPVAPEPAGPMSSAVEEVAGGAPHELVSQQVDKEVQAAAPPEPVKEGKKAKKAEAAPEPAPEVAPEAAPAPAAPVQAQPAAQPNKYAPYGFVDEQTGNAFMDRKGIDRTQFKLEQLGQGPFKIVPITAEGSANAVRGNGTDDVGGRSAGPAVQPGAIDRSGLEGHGPVPVVGRGDASGPRGQIAVDPAGTSAPAVDAAPLTTTDLPLAADGLTSYRYKGRFGWIMIGANDHVDALKQANASLTSEKSELSKLEVWDGKKYTPAATAPAPTTAKKAAPAKRQPPKRNAVKGATLEEARVKHAKQEEAVRMAEANIAKRKAEKAAKAAEDMAGEKINRQWTEFASDSGTLGIDRAAMPQVKAEHRGALVNYLNARGVGHEQAEVPASSLKPTQREFSPAKVEQAKAFEGGDRSILVSSDNHVLDGHHQWLAKLEKGEPVKVIRLDAPIKQLIEDVKEFPSSEVARGAAPAPAAEKLPEAAPAVQKEKQWEYPQKLGSGEIADAVHAGQKHVVDSMNGKISKDDLVKRLGNLDLYEGHIRSITNRLDDFSNGDVEKVKALQQKRGFNLDDDGNASPSAPAKRQPAKRKGEAKPRYSVAGDDYRDEHRAPGREDAAPLSDLTGEGMIYPDDVYSANGPRYYGTGKSYDREAFRIANSMRGKPDAEVTVYRAVPKDVDADINPGDWVGIVKQYAIAHGESRFDGDYRIITKKVRAGDIFTNGDSIQEWGYDPEDSGEHQQGAKQSIGKKPSGGMTIPSLVDHLVMGPAGEVIGRLIGSKAIMVHSTPIGMPEEARAHSGVQAATMPDGTIHLVAGNLTDKNALAVLLHEAFHAGAEKLVGGKAWKDLMARMESLARQGKTTSGAMNEFYKAAQKRVAAASAQGAVAEGMKAEEFAAYAIEEYASAPPTVKKWVNDLVGAMKAWLLARFGKQMGDVTPAQLRALAVMAIKDSGKSSRGDAAFSVGPGGIERRARTIEVDGVRRPITNSNGQLVADDFAKQKAFWNWFGDSKVVDTAGKPLVMYHGTHASISEFDTRTYGALLGKGSYFTVDPEDAAGYARQEGGRIMPVYLLLKNPLVVDSVLKAVPSRAELATMGHDGIVRMKYGAVYWAVAFDPAQIKSATGNNGAFSPDNADIRYSVAAAPADDMQEDEADTGLTPPEQGLLRKVQASVQYNMNRVAQVQQRIEKLTGAIDEKSNYELAEVNRPGRIATRIEDGNDHLFKPLLKELADSGHTPSQLEELLHAMHAQERNASVNRINADEKAGSGMTDAKAAETLARYEGDDFEKLHELADKVRAIARATLDLKNAYGLVTPERYADLTEHYEFYVPLKGDGEYGVKIKQAMGHGEREEYILPNIMRDYKQAVIAGEKNLARQSLLRMVLQHPDSELWEVGMPPKGLYVAGKVYDVFKGKTKVASFGSKAEVTAFMEMKKGEAVNYRVVDSTGMQVAEFTKPLQDNEVMVYLKGQPVRIQIYDEALAKQLRPLDQTQMNFVFKASASLNRWYSKAYTGYNPAFILRNVARDTITGGINMTGNYGAATAAKAYARYPAAWYAMLKWAATKKIPEGHAGDMLREYRNNGGKVGASWMGDLEAQTDTMQSMYDNARGIAVTATDGGAWRASKVAFHKSIGALAHVVEVANQAFENALRLALYTELRHQGATPAKAAQAAKSVTVDFDRRGASTSALSAAYLFFNPAVQGTANAINTLAHGEHKGQAWALMGGLASLGYLVAAMGHDQDKDRWLGEKWGVRSKTVIIGTGDHQVRIPMSQEFAPFYAFGVGMAEAARGENKFTTALRMASSFVDAYVPLRGVYDPDSDNHGADIMMAITPSLLQMPAQIGFNRNSFGSQIVPESPQTKDRPDNLKMNRSTKNSAYDKAAQGIAAVGEKLGAGKYENDASKVSPETLKLLWANFTGGLGTFIADSIGAGGALVSGTPLEAGEVPIVKDFYRNQNVKPLRSRYYDVTKDARKAIDELRQATKAGDGDAADAIMSDKDKAAFLGMGKFIEHNRKAVAALRDEAVDVNADTTLTAGQKKVRLKELEDDEERLYRDAIKAFQQ